MLFNTATQIKCCYRNTILNVCMTTIVSLAHVNRRDIFKLIFLLVEDIVSHYGVAYKFPSHSVIRMFSAHWIQKQLICIKKIAIIIFLCVPLSLVVASWLTVRVCLAYFLYLQIHSVVTSGIPIAKHNEKKKQKENIYTRWNKY